MASTSTIVLTGVVYLAQLRQAGSPVLRAEMVRSNADQVSTHGGVIPRHVAFIKIPSDAIDDGNSTRLPDLKFSKGLPISLFILDGEDLGISGTSSNKLDFPPLPAPPLTPPPKPTDETAFKIGVLKASNFCPTCRRLTAADFDDPDLLEVGGSITLKVGSVVATALSPCTAWNFDAEAGNSALTQNFLAREIKVALVVDDGKQLVINLTSLADPDATPLVIKLKADTPVKITIGSATIEDILESGAPHGTDRVDHHFELFYHLLEGSNHAGHPLPVADPSCGGSFHRLNGVDCPPVLR